MSTINLIDLYTLYELNNDKLDKVKSFDKNNYIGKVNYIFKVLETLLEKLYEELNISDNIIRLFDGGGEIHNDKEQL
jgi:hypothetical protein